MPFALRPLLVSFLALILPVSAPAVDVEAVDAWLQSWAAAGFLSGCVLVADGEEIVYERCFGEALAEGRVPHDAKTAFQEWAHAELRETPRYRLVDDSGIEDDDARFTVEVSVGEERYGRGVGRTKPCGSKISKLEKDTVFLSLYNRFEGAQGWTNLLISGGKVVAKDVEG